MLIRLAGAIELILGLLFWNGYALQLIPVHMLIGSVMVLSLLTLAFLAARAGVNPGLVALAVLWGIVIPVLGMTQTQLLPGDAHWVIKVLHQMVGMSAIGLAEVLAKKIKHVQTSALHP